MQSTRKYTQALDGFQVVREVLITDKCLGEDLSKIAQLSLRRRRESKILLHVERTDRPFKCPCCGGVHAHAYKLRERTVDGVPDAFVPVAIRFTVHRLYCPDCGKTWVEDIPFLSKPTSRCTKQLEKAIVALRGDMSIKALSATIGLSWGRVKTRAYVLPHVEVRDAPSVKWRGMHFCWMPELSAEFVEREIRMAAYLKFNHVVLESWGVFRSERHPWFGWPDRPMTKDVIRHLKDVADELGVTLVPQLNALGHASSARGRYQKHAVLDLHPERQPLFEPMGGWNWCLSNEEGMAILHDIMVEMHEAFSSPPYFHIGCDEAYQPSCPECREGDWRDRIVRHVTGLHDLFVARGTRLLMWHDMFVSPIGARCLTLRAS